MTILSAGFVLLGPCPLLQSVLGSNLSSLFIALVMIGARRNLCLLQKKTVCLGFSVGPGAGELGGRVTIPNRRSRRPPSWGGSADK